MSSVNTDSNIISTVLDRLQNLEPNKYIIAFGPGGKQFIGTPNGYFAQVILAYMADCLTDYVTSTHLPSRPLAELSGCDVKRVLWVSFGEKSESWFFAYEFNNGAISLRLGEDAPDALHNYIDRISTSKLLLRSLRVQLGKDGSFVVWSRTAWACCNVPELLCIQLCLLSSTSRDYNGVTKGSLKKGSITIVQWHKDGSFFLCSSNYCRWAFRTAIVRGAWRNLWQDCENGKPGPEHMAELAYVAINAHAATSETFAFIKKQKAGEETPFILHFDQEPVYARLFPDDRRLQHVDVKPEDTHFLWAVSKRAGRPHRDEWELDLNKGERVKVLQDMGCDWFVVEGRKAVKGWVHRSWLNFSNGQLHRDPKTAYSRFIDEMQKILVPGQLRSFPSISDYIDLCTRSECRSTKDDGNLTGVCYHDLEGLLRGSGRYSYAWLKEERNIWHPDRFSRFCQADFVDQLKVKAEQMFVLYGVLMQAEKP